MPPLVFLSTPSARRATHDDCESCETYEFLSTPSARRATEKLSKKCPFCGISIHALREEGDMAQRFIKLTGKISIHALREEGDRLTLHN